VSITVKTMKLMSKLVFINMPLFLCLWHLQFLLAFISHLSD